MAVNEIVRVPADRGSVEVAACLLCRATDLVREPFAYEFEGITYPGGRCRSCGFVFLLRQPDPATLTRMYGEDYFQTDYHCGHACDSYFDRGAEERAAADVLLGILEGFGPRGRLLEVGCAGGFFLDAARARGWEVTGVEYSGAASHFAREDLGLDVRTGSLESAGFADGEFDALYMGDVLEHVVDPMATLAEVRRLLRPRGRLLLSGPITIHSWDRRFGRWVYGLLGRSMILRTPPYHLVEFTPRTQRLSLERAGFQVLRLEQSKIPPNWRMSAGRAPWFRVAKWAFGVPNAMWTRWTGRDGDRILVVARRGD